MALLWRQIMNLMEKVLKYSNDRTYFGKGPERPFKTGHCSNEACGDAIGVRLWIKSKTENKVTRRFIRELWWSGIGCEYCLATAALLAERLRGTELGVGNEAHLILLEVIKEFQESSDCVLTAVQAFMRAINWEYYTDVDWTDIDCEYVTNNFANLCFGDEA